MSLAQSTIDDASIFSNKTDDRKSQYLTFILAGEEYGVDILRVQEIKGWNNVTPLPNTPAYIKGVMNLRGTIVPIVDLRQRFGLTSLEYGPMTVVIVLKVHSQEKNRIMGIVVDAVSDVYDINAEHMRPPPDFGEVISIEYLKGLASVDDKMVIILDIDHLLSGRELDRATTESFDSDSDDYISTEEQANLDIELLETSFAALAPQAKLLAREFYEKLFLRYPDVKPLFSNVSMEEQQDKLVSALSLVVNNLRKPDELKATLQRLGKRHLDYGAKPAHYEAVVSTLLDTMKSFAGESWTGDIQSAWQNALTTVSHLMQDV